jgi:SAM-dependent methyltransferase
MADVTAPPKTGRRFAPSAARNRDPILEVLRRHLPSQGLVLEIASGTGEHAAHFARHLGPELSFQPSDPDEASRASIDAWVREARLPNLRPALAFDVTAEPWPVARADAVVCINMIHIAPWEAAVGLIKGASRILPSRGLLILYGPYTRGGVHTAKSNEAFDLDLRARNPLWGVRDVQAVAALAAENGLGAPVIEHMPANNLMLIFTQAG